MKSCLQCNKNFKPNSSKSKFCSCLCSGLYNQNCKKAKSWTKIDKSKPHKIKIKKCENCNKEFQKKTKLCSECQTLKTQKRENERAKIRIKEKMEKAKEIKLNIVNSLGGCKHCGYKKSLRALSFHHIDPASKNFTLDTSNIMKKKIKDVYEEVAKCILLCQNCHAELHQLERDKITNDRMNKTDKFKIKIKNKKMSLILYKGSRCKQCNYLFNTQNLQCASFHHLENKIFGMNLQMLFLN